MEVWLVGVHLDGVVGVLEFQECLARLWMLIFVRMQLFREFLEVLNSLLVAVHLVQTLRQQTERRLQKLVHQKHFFEVTAWILR